MGDVKKERIISNQTERIKSAEKKRSTILEEKVEKSKKEFEKIEIVKKEKEIKPKTELLYRLENKLRKGQENHEKFLEKVKEKASVKEPKSVFHNGRSERTKFDLESKMQKVEENKKKNAELFE